MTRLIFCLEEKREIWDSIRQRKDWILPHLELGLKHEDPMQEASKRLYIPLSLDSYAIRSLRHICLFISYRDNLRMFLNFKI